MSDEQADLELADEHIRESQKRIARQEALVQELATDGHDTSNATALLQSFRDTLATFIDHRSLIIQELYRQASRPAE